jgi:hypothetical protein
VRVGEHQDEQVRTQENSEHVRSTHFLDMDSTLRGTSEDMKRKQA